MITLFLIIMNLLVRIKNNIKKAAYFLFIYLVQFLLKGATSIIH